MEIKFYLCGCSDSGLVAWYKASCDCNQSRLLEMDPIAILNFNGLVVEKYMFMFVTLALFACVYLPLATHTSKCAKVYLPLKSSI